jgi:hypothetical protein
METECFAIMLRARDASWSSDGRAMRCVACGTEMVLMSVVPDDRLGVTGFEYHVFICSACHDVERHRVFTRHGRESDPEPLPAIPHRLLHQLRQCRVSTAAPGLFRRVAAKMRGRENDALRSPEPVSVPATPPTSFPAEPVPFPTAGPSTVPSEADLDELEALLRRATEMPPRPTRHSR